MRQIAVHLHTAFADRPSWHMSRDDLPSARIASKGIEPSQKLGKHCWIIERTIASPFGYHRLGIRYERHANHFCAFLTRRNPHLLQETYKIIYTGQALRLLAQ